MLPPTPTILIVDDDPAMRGLLVAHLGRRGHAVATCATGAAALTAAAAARPAVVLADIRLGGAVDGLTLCRQLRADHAGLPVILMTSFGTMDTAIEALRAGAFDFVPKPFRFDDLAATVTRALHHARSRPPAAATMHAGMIGSSPAVTALGAMITKLARSDAPVLITGESGTGKELVARALHAAGPRAAGPFVAVNCAAIPAGLLESELFGHTRGAFTGADATTVGLFAAASGGTLFLDELAELPLDIQPKLLRAIQQRTVRPVGATTEIPFHVRLVSATNRDLARAIAGGDFRRDLYFRVCVIQLDVPPLRARGPDLFAIADDLLRTSGLTLAPDAADALRRHRWPGNIRELQNCLAHAVALAAGSRIELADLPPTVQPGATPPDAELVEHASLDAIERRHVVRVLDDLAGNKTAAARVLGIERRTLYRMLDRWRT